MENPEEQALDQLKIGGDVEKAKVYATLALVQAVKDNTEEIRSLGAEAYPLYVISQ